MTAQERVWRCIKASNAPMTRAEIASDLGMPPERVGDALYGIRKTSALTLDGKGPAARYSIPPGETYQGIGKGNAPGSRRALCPWNWQKGLEAINRKRIRGHSGRKAIPKPRPAIALEVCWPSMRSG